MDHERLLEQCNVKELKAVFGKPGGVAITVSYPEPGLESEIGVTFEVDVSIGEGALMSIFRAMKGAYGVGKQNGESETLNRLREMLRIPTIPKSHPVAYYAQGM